MVEARFPRRIVLCMEAAGAWWKQGGRMLMVIGPCPEWASDRVLTVIGPEAWLYRFLK